MTIGNIGNGFLGSTLKTVLESFIDFKVYDKNPQLSQNSFEDTVMNSDILFVGVPTPMKMSNGECDTSIVESVLKDVEAIRPGAAVVLRSTIPPGTTAGFAEKYDLVLFHMPEFLTEKNAVNDFKNWRAVFIGHDSYKKNPVMSEFYKKMLDDIFSGAVNRGIMKCEGVFHTKTVNTELLKYYTNVFLAFKIAMFNEFYFVAKAYGADYKEITDMIAYDSRVGSTHMQVPGHDGDFGYGGHCVKADSKLKLKNSEIISIKELYDRFNDDKDLFVESCDSTCDKIEYKKVKSVVENITNEKMYTFYMNNKKFSCTENHLLPVVRNNSVIVVKAKDITLDDKLFTKTSSWNVGMKGNERMISLGNSVKKSEKFRKTVESKEWKENNSKSKKNKINIGKNNGMKQTAPRKKVSDSRKEYFKDENNRKKSSEIVKKLWKDGRFEGVKVGKSKWHEFNGYKVQGTYELAYIKYLHEQGIKFECHRGRIQYEDENGETHSYYPDFYLPDTNTYVEVKSKYFYDLQKDKFRNILKSNPNLNIRLLLEDDLKEMGVKI